MMSKKPVTKMGKGATLIAENTAVVGDVRFLGSACTSMVTSRATFWRKRAAKRR